jgi:hypothetical protein
MEENDAKAGTIGQYFAALLNTLFTETEGFSGKRPFGNSGWEHDVDKALVKADAIWGEFDEDGYLEDYDGPAASAIVFDTLAFLSKADWNTLTLPVEPKDWYVVYLDLGTTGTPTLSDYVINPQTEKDARALAEDHNFGTEDGKWIALRITE